MCLLLCNYDGVLLSYVKVINQNYKTIIFKDLCVEVPDNSPFDKYRYIVTIFTGSRRNSGTSAVVCLRLVGKMATSSAHVIQVL